MSLSYCGYMTVEVSLGGLIKQEALQGTAARSTNQTLPANSLSFILVFLNALSPLVASDGAGEWSSSQQHP